MNATEDKRAEDRQVHPASMLALFIVISTLTPPDVSTSLIPSKLQNRIRIEIYCSCSWLLIKLNGLDFNVIGVGWIRISEYVFQKTEK